MMKYAEDFPINSEHDLGSHQITAEEIVDFASKYDPQPYHLSEEAGADSFFQGLAASGWNTASIWMKLYVTGVLQDALVQGSPGVDELRWLSPVRPGDTLRGKVTVLDGYPSLSNSDIFTLRKKGVLYRETEDDAVLSLILRTRLVRRATSPS